MKNAMKDQEVGAAGESPAAEIPALLVAGGSCSRLCRSQRATMDAPPSGRVSLLDSTQSVHATACE
jgi:hypothetical protein